MIFAVHKHTKEHRVVPRLDVLSNADWRYIEADADGWIEWNHKSECPLPHHLLTEYRMRDGTVNTSTRGAGALRWCYTYSDTDIIAYRPILEPQAEQVKKWDGVGLPPVGTVCEVYIANRDAWVKTEVRAHDGALALFKNGTGGHYYGRTADGYRPIRTDREQWIEAAMEAAECHDSAPLIRQYFEAIYDNGLARLPGE